MSMRTHVENELEDYLGERFLRFIQFCGVGATGMVVDLSVTTTLLASTHYLLANVVGFLLAVSWNFTGNWLVTFDRPDGSLPHQYVSYVGLHSTTFGLRAVVLTALIEGVGVAALPATLVGVAVAAVANYLGAERILESGLEWFDFAAALNSVAHAVYGSRLRHALKATGAYGLLYRLYGHTLALIYRDDTMPVGTGGETARLQTESPAELVSVLHTVEKERPVLDAFVGSVGPDTVVWDVGANLGVFGALAAQAGATVVAVEPVPATAARCEENLGLNGGGRVVDAALAATDGTATLALERDELGTQTPSLDADAIDGRHELTVETVTGDALIADGVPAPDVLKIDVEGAEAAVLDGLAGALPEVDCVFVEVHGGQAPIRDRLTAAGFDVGVLNHAESGEAYLDGRRS